MEEWLFCEVLYNESEIFENEREGNPVLVFFVENGECSKVLLVFFSVR